MMTTNAGHGGSPSHLVSDYWWYRARTDLLEAALAGFAAGTTTALDLGSADGPSADWLHERIPRVASLDVDPRGLGAGGVCGSGIALPFADGSFDLVSAFDVIEHLDPEATALDQVHRVLRPGGILLMSVPAYQWAWTDHDVANGHYRRYTRRRAVRAVESSGLVVLRATHAFAATFPLFAIERLARRARGPRRADAADVATVPAVPKALNDALLALCRVDHALLTRVDLPFGSSVLVAARKPS